MIYDYYSPLPRCTYWDIYECIYKKKLKNCTYLMSCAFLLKECLLISCFKEIPQKRKEKEFRDKGKKCKKKKTPKKVNT
jgi:hypothetical protein